MKSTELAELFLTRLYDLAETKGHGNYYSLDEIAGEFGEKDRGKVMEVARYLASQGWIDKSITTGGSSARILGAGSVFVEQGGRTGIIQKYRASRNQIPMSDPSNRVFVVHGHNEEMKQSVARTLEKLALKPIILHEQPNQGRTIIEKFIDYSDVGFAVILLSPDDMAYPIGASNKEARTRARQNVILELGFFLGKLGRQHVVTLYQKDDKFELPSDYSGLLYIEYDAVGHWRYQLASELQASGYKDADKNKL
jgi:predicted nucleotide-binding protein